MAPKRSRKGKVVVSSSQPQEEPTFDSSRFVCVEAEAEYHKLIRRPFVAERGVFNELPFSEIINKHGWSWLVKQPGPVIKPIVYEFYANLAFHRRSMVMVRGYQVPITEEAINEYFRLPPVATDEYSQFLHSNINWNTMIGTITEPGSEGPVMANWRHIKRGNLTPVAKAWYYFICARLMPTILNFEVLRKRAILTYAITQGMSLDVGKLIRGEMFATLSPRTKSDSLGFLALITTLCSFADVSTTGSEEKLASLPLVSLKLY